MIYTDFVLTYDKGGAGETALTLPAPMPGYKLKGERTQTKTVTVDGTVYAYDQETMVDVVDYTFTLTAAQKTALDTFFRDTVKGVLNPFHVRDHNGIGYSSCRLDEPQLDVAKTAGRRYTVQLAIRMPSSPE